MSPGDTIALVAPASPLGADQVARAVANLERRGYRVKVFTGASDRRGYLAGDDATRAQALNQAIRDRDVRAILCVRGGYGSPRILDRIDYGTLRIRPKAIVGYSDITAILLAARKRAGIVTFHGPMGREWSLPGGLPAFSEKHFWGALRPDGDLFANWGGARPPGTRSPVTFAPGAAEGVLIGGNLSLVCSLLGTPFEIDTRGAILFLEEVSEKPFRIDRMLNQLRLAGKLDDVRGVLLGGFTGCEAKDPEGDLQPVEVFSDYFLPLGVPVLSEFPAGHLDDQATLPFGVRVRMDATAKTLRLLESPVAAGPEGKVPAAAGG